MRADKPVPILEHEGEADRPEEHATDAGVGDPFDEDVDRLSFAREARLQHHESHLHSEHQECRYERPRSVDSVDLRGLIRSRSIRGVSDVRHSPVDEPEDDRQADQFTSHQQCDVASHDRIAHIASKAKVCAA